MFVFNDPRYAYGGGSEPDDEDNSGILKYVSIRHAAPFSSIPNEHAAMVFASVGRGTVIDHVEVIRTQTNGFSFIGGTVNAYHLVSAYCGNSTFQLLKGYQGKGQFWLVVDSRNQLLKTFGNRPELSYDETIPNTSPELANLTLVKGRTLVDDLTSIGTVAFRDNAAGSLRNSTIINRDYVGFSVQDWTADTFDSWARFQEGSIVVENNRWNPEGRIINWAQQCPLCSCKPSLHLRPRPTKRDKTGKVAGRSNVKY